MEKLNENNIYRKEVLRGDMILVKCDKCNDIIEHGKENLIEINYKEKIHLCNECLKKTLIFIKQSKVQCTIE